MTLQRDGHDLLINVGAKSMVATSIINKRWCKVDPPMWLSRPLLLINVGTKSTRQRDCRDLYY